MKQFTTAVIRNKEGKFLVLYHYKKQEQPWRFPGGKINKDETPLQAIIRECKEEVCIDIVSATLLGKYDAGFIDGDNWEGYFYRIDAYSGTPKIGEFNKVSELTYMDKIELLFNRCHPEYDVVCEHYK